jgi:hypothetical protein
MDPKKQAPEVLDFRLETTSLPTQLTSRQIPQGEFDSTTAGTYLYI